MVHDPMTQETYTAERGAGATLDGRPIQVSGADELIRALLVSSFSQGREEISRWA